MSHKHINIGTKGEDYLLKKSMSVFINVLTRLYLETLQAEREHTTTSFYCFTIGMGLNKVPQHYHSSHLPSLTFWEELRYKYVVHFSLLLI